MAPNRGQNRAKEFKVSNEQKDFDPEGGDISEASQDGEGSSGSESEGDGGREHYVDAGKSRLRKSKNAPLGPQYRGSRISRDDIENEDEDDPLARGFEDEESDGDGGVGLKANGVSGNSDEEDEEDEDETEDTDMEADGVDAKPRLNGMVAAAQREEMLKAARQDQKSVTSSLSQSIKSEAEKGRAVKKQKATFDALLGARIKLQKALIATNTIVGLEEDDELAVQHTGAQEVMEAAETAAFNLWSSLNDLREELQSARTGEKRKRSTLSTSTPTERLWTHMQEQEEATLPHRNVALQRWSRKTQDPIIRAQGALVQKASQTPIIDSIQQHLTGNADHLVRKAHTPRSCAPLQVDRKLHEDAKIYDDADFYGLMLKELLESKSADSLTTSNVDFEFDPRREAKAKRNVDTKASKGRKLRYTVHEKLQNFMAPEDRRRWGDRQSEELFGSLFGRRLAGLGLGEDEAEEDAEGDEKMHGMNENGDGGDGVEGLMLFRR